MLLCVLRELILLWPQLFVFYADNTRMLYGDGQKMAGELLQGIKEL